MSFISKEDFYSHIYEEAIETISRGDEKPLNDAIQTAINQASRCMARYDTVAIFGLTEPEDKTPYAELILYIKDIAKWHFIAVCNVQVDLDLAEKRYKGAIAELDKIRRGDSIPGWPLMEPETETQFRSGSAPKFNHYF